MLNGSSQNCWYIKLSNNNKFKQVNRSLVAEKELKFYHEKEKQKEEVRASLGSSVNHSFIVKKGSMLKGRYGNHFNFKEPQY